MTLVSKGGSPVPTRFTDVLDTNYVPLKEEIDEIHAMLCNPEEEIRRIDEEISRLQAQRDILQQFVSRHRNLVSPFRRLPGELWAEVFVHCLPDNYLPVRSTAEAPLALTAICQRWREVVLNTPRLWTSLHLYLPNPSRSSPSDDFVSWLNLRKEGFELWLRRSGSLPLHLSLAAESGYDHSDFTKIMVKYSRRWKSIALSHLPASALAPFNALSKEDLPLLEDFEEDAIMEREARLNPSQYPPPFIHAVGASPSLRRLRITALVDSAPLNLPVHWARLHLLELRLPVSAAPSIESVPFMHLLVESCPLLSECVLSIQENVIIPTHSTVQSKHWNRLRRLNLELTGWWSEEFESGVNDIFESFTAPALTHLSFSLTVFYPLGIDGNIERYYPTDKHLPFRNFIARSQCVLESLKLSMPLGDGFCGTLDNLTSLTTLSLSSPTWNENLHPRDSSFLSHLGAVIEALMPSEGSVRYPNVERLTFRFCTPQHALALVALIESRARAARLGCFAADFGIVLPRNAKILTSALDLVKSKDLGVKIDWRFHVIPTGMHHYDNPYRLGVVHESGFF
ncbi:hypothetical protein AAF712_013489 [Marasmius tenuissimus]|uniref:F-box domain-containing protein n=1 Tax=Marasmius tenuissimus TaxID=585030 RepID=A0ABR2ZG68_9AGAR